ncbi:hypothetical protein INS49_006364 [Diaporthe citri]|uniref:uncharacterized protein n=1 Tax=Diaporthe citri TaxID=83186 RepID=UPI001C812E07|nr:uncharacterized protein INS49_006364 [Diaporthe citri]KAG6364760.1 hypothetical protein INS49_006364 [Diaporthe citri]
MASHGEKTGDQHTTVDEQEPVSHTNTIEEAKRSSDESSAPSHEVLYAAGIGLRADDPTLPCLTIRIWAIVGLLFELVVKRRQRGWWRRYNFVLSSALDCSVAIAGIVVFFALFYTGASKHFKWWVTEVHQRLGWVDNKGEPGSFMMKIIMKYH